MDKFDRVYLHIKIDNRDDRVLFKVILSNLKWVSVVYSIAKNFELTFLVNKSILRESRR